MARHQQHPTHRATKKNQYVSNLFTGFHPPTAEQSQGWCPIVQVLHQLVESSLFDGGRPVQNQLDHGFPNLKYNQPSFRGCFWVSIIKRYEADVFSFFGSWVSFNMDHVFLPHSERNPNCCACWAQALEPRPKQHDSAWKYRYIYIYPSWTHDELHG